MKIFGDSGLRFLESWGCQSVNYEISKKNPESRDTTTSIV